MEKSPYLNEGSNFNLPDVRQKKAIERFIEKTGCGFKSKDGKSDNWGILLLHKVGTGKTISSLLIALNNLDQRSDIVIVPPVGLFGNFVEDYNKITDKKQTGTTFLQAATFGLVGDSGKTPGFNGKQVNLTNYDYDMLIADVNSRNCKIELTDKIIIFDEAHRLLTKVIFNSTEANYAMEKHSLLEDQYFINTIYKAKHAILLTGTPLQKTASDLCLFSNFLTKTKEFTLEKYSPRTLNASAEIFLMRHWKWMVGLVPAIATATLSTVGHILPDEYKWLEPLIIYAITAKLTGDALKKSGEGSGGRSKKIKRGKNKTIKGGTLFDYVKMLYTPKDIINDALIEPTNVQIQTVVAELEEPKYEMSLLAKDMSPFMSVYDYELQDGDCDVGESSSSTDTKRSLMEVDRGEVESSTPKDKRGLMEVDRGEVKRDLEKEKKEKENLKNNFPKKILIVERLEYNNAQLLMQYKSIVRPNDMTFIEKSILRINPYEKKSIDLLGPAKEFRKNGKFLGNFSEDVLSYFTKLDTSDIYKNTKYIYEFRYGIKRQDGKSQKIFECKKFNIILARLLCLLKHNYFPLIGVTEVTKHETEENKALNVSYVPYEGCVEYIDKTLEDSHYKKGTLREGCNINDVYFHREQSLLQPHSTIYHRYLPLIYSYTEDYGTALFGCFLTSMNIRYILVHTSQKGLEINPTYKGEFEAFLSPADKTKLQNKITNKEIQDLLDFNKFLAFDVMYEILSGTPENGPPLCILLDPTMTEGLNATYNPAMFILEPCNTFGDQEQVYGRVLRKYNLSTLVGERSGHKDGNQYPKVIYQYIMSEGESKEYLGEQKINRSIGKDLSDKMSYLKASHNPVEYFKNAAKFFWQFPDEFYSKRILRESENLKDFEKGIEYGVLCSDQTFISNCKGKSGQRGGKKNTKRTLRRSTFKSPNIGQFISGTATLPCAFEMHKGVKKVVIVA